MVTRLRLATFNLENLDDVPGDEPSIATRRSILGPQLARVDADVLCLQEVHGQLDGATHRLRALETLLAGTPYAGFATVSTVADDGSGVLPQRNLVVLSRFPIVAHQQINQSLVQPPLYRAVTANPPQVAATAITWDRPLLHVEIELPGNRRLHVINVHLKSKIPVTVPGQTAQVGDPPHTAWVSASGQAEGAFMSAIKRIGQALELRRLVDALFDATPDALIAACGDFNADADDVPLQAIRGDVEETDNPQLAGRVMVSCERTVPEPSRYSLFHRGRGHMLDHVLVSRALLAHYRTTEIHNELLHDETIAFAVDAKFPESDHAPVVASFELRDV